MNHKLFSFLPLVAVVLLAATGCNQESSNGPDNTTKGALSGKFSVSSSKQVVFSQGNLQYQASTKTWRFAENQWDIVGQNNKYVADDYEGWIDLFAWATGNNPTLNIAVPYGADENSEEVITYFSHFTTFNDWGDNAISNGGNKAKLWRTLSANEWQYILCERESATTLFGLGSVNGMRGLILLPDDWMTPDDVTFTPSNTVGLEFHESDDGDKWYNDYDEGDYYSNNIYSASEWAALAKAGAVFLPAAGGRMIDENEEVVMKAIQSGFYWSSTALVPYGLALEFDEHYVLPKESEGLLCSFGLSVRLVQDVK